mmetsp:Transcript_10552/g.17250  ORF Transcript_10552/g.17250 Transcript_10552/m.17250 type:complete len:114 (-) Transcript_10552:726-1067(-)
MDCTSITGWLYVDSQAVLHLARDGSPLVIPLKMFKQRLFLRAFLHVSDFEKNFVLGSMNRFQDVGMIPREKKTLRQTLSCSRFFALQTRTTWSSRGRNRWILEMQSSYQVQRV